MPGIWTDRAACRYEDPELFFPLGHGSEFTAQLDNAKAICRRCPVAPECLDEAIDAGHQGIWGGTHEDERRKLRVRRRAQTAQPEAPEGSKACSTCGQTKPLTAFYTDQRNRDGRQGRCKACHLDKVAVPGASADEQAARRRAALVDA